MSFALKLAFFICIAGFAAAGGLMPHIVARLNANQAAPAPAATPAIGTVPTHLAATSPLKDPEPQLLASRSVSLPPSHHAIPMVSVSAASTCRSDPAVTFTQM
jgi:hypothetical protein